VRFLVDVDLYFLETKPARQREAALQPSTEIEPSLARRGKSTLNVDRLGWAGIPLFPDRVIRPDRAVDLRGLRLQRAYVKRQHKPLKIAGLDRLFQCSIQKKTACCSLVVIPTLLRGKRSELRALHSHPSPKRGSRSAP